MVRSDFIIPGLLLVALMVMAVYATTGDEEEAAGPASVAACEPPRLIARLPQLPEASGLAASRRQPKLLWSHNDSSEAALYGIAADGSLRTRLQLTGASVIDWEAVTVAPCAGNSCVYVGDIGDNDGARRTITVYRAHEPPPSESADSTTAPAEALHASYPEGAQDAEALFSAAGSLFVVTKGEGAPVRLYRFPALDGDAQQTLQLVATLTDGDPRKAARVTDAATSPDGQWVALRTNDVVWFYRTAALVSGTPDTPLSYELGVLNEPQGEGIAWADANTLYLAGESEAGGTLASLSCTLPK